MRPAHVNYRQKNIAGEAYTRENASFNEAKKYAGTE